MLRLCLTVFVVLQVSACGLLPTDPHVQLSGTYLLETIDGNPVPMVRSDDESLRIVDVTGSYVLRRDKTCRVTGRIEVTFKHQNKTVEKVFDTSCTYRIAEGDRVVITTTEKGVVYDVERDGDVIVDVVSDGTVYRYRKS